MPVVPDWRPQQCGKCVRVMWVNRQADACFCLCGETFDLSRTTAELGGLDHLIRELGDPVGLARTLHGERVEPAGEYGLIRDCLEEARNDPLTLRLGHLGQECPYPVRFDGKDAFWCKCGFWEVRHGKPILVCDNRNVGPDEGQVDETPWI